MDVQDVRSEVTTVCFVRVLSMISVVVSGITLVEITVVVVV